MAAQQTEQESRPSEQREFQDKPMDFTEHLEELRWRFIRGILYVLVAGIPVAYFFHGPLVDFLLRPANMVLENDQFLLASFQEPLFLLIKIVLLAGIVVASPAWLTELFLFIRPALTRRERRHAYSIAFFCPFLFLLGAAFAYTIIPFALQVLYGFKDVFPNSAFFPRVNEFLGLILTIMIGMGIVFQMPLVVALLAKLGVVSSGFLASKRRHAILIMAILAAVITPTVDIVNFTIVFLPIIVLYEVSVWIARAFEPKTSNHQRRFTFGGRS